MARPYKPDPTIEVVFGTPLGPDKTGQLPIEKPFYRPNPPDPDQGMTLVKQVRGKRYWMSLEESDQLSQAEAAVFLRVSRMQVNRWVRAGKLEDKKILGTSRITVGELLRFAEENAINLRERGLWLVG